MRSTLRWPSARLSKRFSSVARAGVASFCRRCSIQALLAERCGFALVLHDHAVRRRHWAGRRSRAPCTGVEGPAALHRLAGVVDERLHLAAVMAADEGIADFQRAGADDDGRGGAAALLDLRLDHRAARGAAVAGCEARALRPRAGCFRAACRRRALRWPKRGTTIVSPPQSSGTRPFSWSCPLTLSTFAPGISIFVMATMICTFAARA